MITAARPVIARMREPSETRRTSSREGKDAAPAFPFGGESPAALPAASEVPTRIVQRPEEITIVYETHSQAAYLCEDRRA
ncbi:MAG TPA: hypothetical protein VFV10_06790 [Gammaproteobacteria bacterium]|nr:hypothetical protein [Gammaproteobacteria bacterium]